MVNIHISLPHPQNPTRFPISPQKNFTSYKSVGVCINQPCEQCDKVGVFCLSKLTSQTSLSHVVNFPRFPSVSLALACRPAMNELIKVDRKLCCLVGSAGSSADPSADYPKYWKKMFMEIFSPVCGGAFLFQ